jgi:hypothetical protein
MDDSEGERKVAVEMMGVGVKQSHAELWEAVSTGSSTLAEEQYDRIRLWFQNMGVHPGSPE